MPLTYFKRFSPSFCNNESFKRIKQRISDMNTNQMAVNFVTKKSSTFTLQLATRCMYWTISVWQSLQQKAVFHYGLVLFWILDCSLAMICCVYSHWLQLATLHKVIGTLIISQHIPTRKELYKFTYIPIIA